MLLHLGCCPPFADLLNERLNTVSTKDPRYDAAKKTLFQFEARPPEVRCCMTRGLTTLFVG